LDKPVDVFVTVTVALGTTPPVSSVNVPTMDPYRTCADAARAAYPMTVKTVVKHHRPISSLGTLLLSFTVHLLQLAVT
jgi:hypothetical protein